ncbi:MAG TPA: carbohydrate ABC transporter permease [Clostridiaceae bacterium]|nr:carbohydrate ABC transporter permease [Clostridiaceae bacterium]
MKRLKFFRRTFFIRFILILYSIIVIIPFLMIFINSFKTNREFYESIWALPRRLNFDNYVLAFEQANISQYFLNTVIVCVTSVILTLSLSTMVSYAIARRKMKSGPKLYFLFLIGLLIPQIVGIVPLFLMARVFRLFDTLFILILSYATATIPFCVFVLTAFFKTLPSDLEEAARIDGASNTHVLISIMTPLAKPGLITAGVFCFLDYWSEYMKALAFIATPSRKTISLGMLTFKPVSGFKIDWGVLCAACVLFILPVVVVYAVFQRNLLDGLTAGAIKG